MSDFLTNGPAWLAAVVLVGLAVGGLYAGSLFFRWVWHLGESRTVDEWEDEWDSYS